MATYAKNPAPEPNVHPSVKDQATDMVQDIQGEVTHEAKRIYTEKNPVDPSQSDHVVRRHVAGLSITFFIAIALFLLIAIAGIAIYTHGHH